MQVSNIRKGNEITRLKLLFGASPHLSIFVLLNVGYYKHLLSDKHLFIRKFLAFIVTFALVLESGMLKFK